MASELGHGSQGGVEGISELLRCYICTELLTDATICPHCSKLGCYACINRWVAKNRADCPHCRASLSTRQLIRIPVFDDLCQFLNSLKSTREESRPPNSTENERCPLHQQNQANIYCETCQKIICHECALWAEEHKGHCFKPVDVFFRKHKELIKAELYELKERMKVLMGQVQQVERTMEEVKANKSKAKRDLHHAVEKMHSQLDNQAKVKLTKLGDSKHRLKSQIVEIATVSHQLEEKMKSGSISSLLTKSGEMKQELKEKLKTLYSTKLDIDQVHGQFVNEVVPSYDSAVFKIHPFRELQRQGAEIYSKPLVSCGLKWRLKVYPNGHREDTGKYLGVFVELTEGYDRTTNYQYSIEMLYNGSSRYPHKNYKREYASDFADGESWGYRKFYELSKLEESGFMRENAVMLKFSVRALSYYQKCQDLTLYANKLEAERDGVSQQLQAARQQLAALKNESRAMASGRSPGTQRGTPATVQQDQTLHVSTRPRNHHHQHSYSAPHDPDEARRAFMSASQQPLRNSSHATPSPKHSYRHSDSHMFQPDSMMSSFAGWRRDDGGHRQRVSNHRRRSADPAVTYRYEQQGVSSSNYRTSRDPPHLHHELRQSQDRLHQESVEVADSDRRTRSHQRLAVPPHNPALPSDPLIRSNVLNGFEDCSGDERGESQSWQTVDHTDIMLSLEDEERYILKSGSSSSTIVQRPPSPHRMSGPPRMSQEQFDEEDHSDMMSLSTLAEEESLSTQYFHPSTVGTGLDQDGGIPPSFAKHESHFLGLSQPSVPSSRYGKSLTDLPSLTSSSSNLSHTQYLSQSVVEMPQYGRRDVYSGRYPEMMSGRAVRASQSYSHGHLNRMSSDSHLNADGPPGLKMSVVAAMTNMQEEIERQKHHRMHQNKYLQPKSHASTQSKGHTSNQSKGHISSQQKSQSKGHVSSQSKGHGSSQNKSYTSSQSKGRFSAQQRPKVSHENREQERSNARTPERSPLSQRHHNIKPIITTTAPPEGVEPSTQEPKPASPSSSSARLLSAGGKSSSTSSLSNLNLI